MITEEQIKEALLDDYGGCRDINFENPTWDGVNNLVRWFFRNYSVTSVSDYQGSDVTMEFANERNLPLTELPEEFHILSGENSAMIIRGMQIYIGNPENGEKAPLVELTFFPSDLDKAFSVVKFAQFVEEVKQILQASWYYVRTENASWKFGTSGYGTGVIFQPSDVKDIT